MWNDIETTEDFLNFQVVANTAAKLILESENQPISLGVSGSWGAGKSSLAKMIVKNLKDNEGSKLLFVEFDAWLYQGYEDAKASILHIVSGHLLKEAKDNEDILTKVKQFISRINWLHMGKAVAVGAATAVAGGSLLGPLGSVVGSIYGIVKNVGTTPLEKIEQLDNTFNSLGEEAGRLIKDKANKSIPKEISELREMLQDILRELDVKLVVTIDDLDRCLPSTAISTLEAVRLLLFMERTAFIIAADETMIRNAVRAHFGDDGLSDDLVTSYFDKLIQIPIQVPRAGISEVKIYLASLLIQRQKHSGVVTEDEFLLIQEKLQELLQMAWKNPITYESMDRIIEKTSDNLRTQLMIADRIAEIMVMSNKIQGNPRLIKRFLNDLMIRREIASQQNLELPFEEQIKMQLFERCASSKAYEVLVNHMSSVDGTVDFLNELELYAKGEIKDTDIEFPDKSWEEPFIKEWLEIEPKLGNLDLRPYIYLSRNRSQASKNFGILEAEAQRIYELLIQGESSPNSLLNKISGLEENQKERLLTRMINDSRKTQWEPKLIIKILEMFPYLTEFKDKFESFLNEIPPAQRNVGFIPRLQESFDSKFLSEWRNDPNTPENTIKAIVAYENKYST